MKETIFGALDDVNHVHHPLPFAVKENNYELLQPTIHAQENSIALGTASVVNFAQSLQPGDSLRIVVPVTSTWSSGGGPGATNADGVVVEMGPPVKIKWSTLNPGTPEAKNVPNTPNAVNFSFGVGCLVGSLDKGKSFFAVGTNFQMTVLSKNIDSLWLYYWDVNKGDNSGQLSAAVSISLPQ